MKKTLKKAAVLSLIIGTAFTMTACYETIPAGKKGKIMGKNGFQPEIYPPSRVWLSNNLWNRVKEKLYLIETTTERYNLPVTVLLKDKMTVTVPVSFRCRITDNEDVINAMFNDLKNNDNIVTVDEVYRVYGAMLVESTVRTVVSQYNVDELPSNYKKLNIDIFKHLDTAMANVPLELSDIVIGQIGYPKEVTGAIVAAKKRRMEIEKEQAQTQINLTKKAGEEKLADAEYNIKMKEAKRIRDYNKMTADGITPELLQLRQLEVQEAMVRAIQNNQNVIYMPMDMMNGMRFIMPQPPRRQAQKQAE